MQTHFVSSITYGAKVNLIFELECKDKANKEEVGAFFLLKHRGRSTHSPKRLKASWILECTYHVLRVLSRCYHDLSGR
jgi:hypothetical protein